MNWKAKTPHTAEVAKKKVFQSKKFKMENMGIQKTVMHYQSARGKKGGGGGDAAAPLAALERLLADGGLIFNDAKQDALITSGTGCHTGALCAERPDTLQPVLCSSRSRSLRCDSVFSLGHRDWGGAAEGGRRSIFENVCDVVEAR